MQTGASHLYELVAGGGAMARCLAQWEAADVGDSANDRAYRSARWSPDGTLVATVSEDNAMRVYDADFAVQQYANGATPDGAQACGTQPMLTAAHAETVLDYAWHPHASRYAGGAYVAESVRDHPIHLRSLDAAASAASQVRASYRAADAADCLLTATALGFTPDAHGLFAGYAGHLAHFDVARPGLPTQLVRTSPARRSRDGMKGIVSCVARMDSQAPAQGLVACASLHSHVALYSRTDLDSCVASWAVPREYAGSGVTALRWARAGTVVWAASRRSPFVVAWDVRDLRGPWMVVRRPVSSSNQRLEIDVDGTGRHLVAGHADGSVSVYDSDSADGESVAAFAAHADAVPALAMHPFYPLLATASGQRHFESSFSADCSLKIWSLAANYLPSDDASCAVT
ncbi:hypothetical protein GGI11_007234 [Coemansia sp. RSA 2049]|nr:hypothetical protein GGI11_007234 [Coemansia sp. RSA 2049]